jgi:hypothetical protein
MKSGFLMKNFTTKFGEGFAALESSCPVDKKN